MSNSSTPVRPGSWRLLILDRDPDDPKWVMATVMLPEDVRPAHVIDSRYTDWDELTSWLRTTLGRPGVDLVPLHRPEVWRIDE
jgi:hypothetical protein